MKVSRRSVLFLPALGLLPRRMRSSGPSQTRADVRMLFGGDIMLSRYVGRLARQKHDPAWPLHEVTDLLGSADIAFANLESPFSDRGRSFDKGMVFQRRAGDDRGARVGRDRCRLHGQQSCPRLRELRVEFTLDWLAKHGIAAVGTAGTAEAGAPGCDPGTQASGFRLSGLYLRSIQRQS